MTNTQTIHADTWDKLERLNVVSTIPQHTKCCKKYTRQYLVIYNQNIAEQDGILR